MLDSFKEPNPEKGQVAHDHSGKEFAKNNWKPDRSRR
jgi:hypothetical protein